MALDDNIDAVRNLHDSGEHAARLLGYLSIGVLPSRENIAQAKQWLVSATDKLAPVLNEAEADRASQRFEPRPKG
ncbi:hypothetical protein C0Z18_30810 [Trinickia dabaoshanensis]|uniref:Uncharacterized protein n=1 Tax=Trinickia dabaoshanensis TaxID=564714 RepID=A0A2N7VBU8_9BURK|nr:hypothetical protein [Trinickia dabaoshanensis]PMS14640.1 hypothetical protein C0Z18_30810 [Trinickia dabaoshanensis]